MTTARLETFSVGVIAIVITAMVLELGIPRGVHLDALRPLLMWLIPDRRIEAVHRGGVAT